MAKHTTETRRRQRSNEESPERWSKRIELAVAELRVFVADRAKNRGEAAMMLGAILAEVLRIGVESTERREELLGQIIEMIRKLWKREDEREHKTETPVM